LKLLRPKNDPREKVPEKAQTERVERGTSPFGVPVGVAKRGYWGKKVKAKVLHPGKKWGGREIMDRGGNNPHVQRKKENDAGNSFGGMGPQTRGKKIRITNVCELCRARKNKKGK